MDVRRNENVAVAGGGAVEVFLFCGGGAHGAVVGDRPFHEAAGDFAFLVHAFKLGSLDGFGHFGVDLFDAGKHADLRVFAAKAVERMHGVVDKGFFLFKAGVGEHAAVNNGNKLVAAGNCRDEKRAHQVAVVKAGAGFYNALQQCGGIKLAFHEEVCFALSDKLDGFCNRFGYIGAVIDVFFRNGSAHFAKDFYDSILVADQNRLRKALIHGKHNSFDGVTVACVCNGDAEFSFGVDYFFL